LINDTQAPLLPKGGHPWAHMKYYQWAVGGNGGLLPMKTSDAVPAIDAKDRRDQEHIREMWHYTC